MRGLWLGALFATLSIVQFVTSPIFGTLSDEKGRKTILLLALTANFLGCLLTNFAVELENLNLLLFARVLVGMGAGGTAVILAIVADLSPPMLLAKNFGLFNTFRYLGYAAGMYMSGGLSHVPIFNISPFEKPFAVATLGSLICVILILFFFKETHLIAKKGVALKNFFTNLVKGFQIARLNMLLIIFLFFSLAGRCIGNSCQ